MQPVHGFPSPRNPPKNTGTCSSEDDEAEDFYAVDGVVSRLALRDWKVLENAWCRWLKLYRDWQHSFTADDRDSWARPLYLSVAWLTTELKAGAAPTKEGTGL